MNVNEVKSFLKVVILSQLLVEANDSLRSTKFYKQALKHQLNRTSKMLDDHVGRAFNTVYGNDPEMCTNVMNAVDRIVDFLCTAQIDQLVMIESIIQAYLDNPEEINKEFNAKFTKINT